MFASASKAAAIFFEPAFLGVVLKALALTALLFLLIFAGALYGLHYLPAVHLPLLGGFAALAASGLLVLLAMFLGAPVAALFASLFLGEIASAVEAKHYPTEPPGSEARFWQGMFMGLRLFCLLVLSSLLMLPLDVLLPGFGSILSLVVQGWLLGRTYFELAALRHLDRRAADQMRRRHLSSIVGGGTLIAIAAAIPLVNLLAPLFGTALMVHEFKRYTHEELPT
jgi:CysZ protein